MLTRSVVLTLASTLVVAVPASGAVTAGPGDSRQALAQSPELSVTNRLDDRRAVVIGDRFYGVSSEDGLYPATGWHIRGEMGGLWAPPVKLLDGIWFAVDGSWLGAQAPAERFSSGYGYTRTEYGSTDGVSVERTDVAPDGMRAGLIGLTFTADDSRTVQLDVDAHSELMTTFPWGWTSPDQTTFNLADTGSYADDALVFQEQGTPPTPNADRHDFAALVAADRAPTQHALGPDHRGPQQPAVICPTTGDPPQRCDDTAFGKGTGGRLTYDVRLRGDRPVTVWIAVAGSDDGIADARGTLAKALRNPERLLADKVSNRMQLAGNTVVDLPGDPLLQQSIEWSKQNLADSVQHVRDLRLRVTHEGRQYPEPAGVLKQAGWLGAGWPDYPWLFGTDGEYTAFASVAAGQFEPIKAHLRALRDASEIVNEGSGKVVHEVTHDGAVYFGHNDDPGNTDETSKFPSAVALVWRWTGDDAFRDDLYGFSVRAMRYVVEQLDDDGDGWPEGLGNVERSGMGVEKLDNTVYTIRGLRDLADMARSKHDTDTAAWATSRAERLEAAFDQAWWFGGDTDQYADSLDNPSDPANDNSRIFQRHWIGVTPMDAMLVRPGQGTRPLATDEHGQTALAKREEDCYSGEFGLFHTGTGPTSAEKGNPGASCDSAVSSVPSERVQFGLNTAIMAVAEGNFGRLGADQQQRYTTANARIHLDPDVWEMPGAMPEIAPSPDFTANIDQRFTDRSMVLQAWGTYGTLWPVVHHQLGVSPDLGRDVVEVVPQLPPDQTRIAGDHIRLGSGWVDVSAEATSSELRTTADSRVHADLLVGQVLPDGAQVASVSLNGRSVDHRLRHTARGDEVIVDAGGGRHADLVISLR
jgi:hypothetical protein